LGELHQKALVSTKRYDYAMEQFRIAMLPGCAGLVELFSFSYEGGGGGGAQWNISGSNAT
jgi:hypothetical protein